MIKKNRLFISVMLILLIILVAVGYHTYNYSYALSVENDSIDDLVLSRVNEIRNTGNTNISNRTGKVYYVSNDGDDSNPGTEELPWRTIDKVRQTFDSALFNAGDTILFKRGDVFRGNIGLNRYDILLGSYGDVREAKPEILVSSYDGAHDGEWIEEKTNIWRYTVNGKDPFEKDVGTVWFFCKTGNNNCSHSMNTLDQTFSYASKKMTNKNIDESTLDLTTILTNDLDMYHYGHASASDSSTKAGALYVYSIGNPSERFDEIEFSEGIRGINVGGCTDTQIDNLTIKYAGNHGVGSASIANLKVTNSEIAFIGGAVQSYDDTTFEPVRYGNAVEIWGEVKSKDDYLVKDGFVINNTYIYQVYDAGMTFQLSSSNAQQIELVNFNNNVVEYCNYNVEYWNKSNSTNSVDQDNTYINKFYIKNNIMRYSGVGISETRPNKLHSCHIKTWLQSTANFNKLSADGKYIIDGNIFFGASEKNFFIWAGDNRSLPTFSNNTVYGNKDVDFGYYSEFQDNAGGNYSKYESIKYEPNILTSRFSSNNKFYYDDYNNDSNVSVVGVILDKNNVELKEGENTKLSATVFPSDASNKNVSWSSSNPEIATVDNNGKVIAISEGTAAITVTTEDGNYKANCVVVVNRNEEAVDPNPSEIKVTGVTVTPTEKSLKVGENTKLSATVTPSNASNKNVSWSSSDSSVASVDDNGNVTAISEGIVIITVTTNDGKEIANSIITVVSNDEDNSDTVLATEIKLNMATGRVKKGNTFQLIATVVPDTATNKEIVWTSSDSGIASVDDNGIVNAKEVGDVVITAKIKDTTIEKTATIKVIEDSGEENNSDASGGNNDNNTNIDNKNNAEAVCLPYLSYSTTNNTSSPVVAVINFQNKDCRVTNDSSYTFNDNGNYTFEYVDSDGNKGTLLASVDWINKNASNILENPKTGVIRYIVVIIIFVIALILGIFSIKKYKSC